MEKKNNNKVIFLAIGVIVGVMVLCGCGGILAAIAIPAFQRYINASKAAEAKVMTRSLSSAVQMSFAEDCKFPPPLPQTFEPGDCCGQTCDPTGVVPEFWSTNAPSLGLKHYAYSAQPGLDDTFVVTAIRDTDCAGTRHTTSITVRGAKNGDVCEAIVDPPISNQPW